MKKSGHPLLSLAAPALILLATVCFFQRQGRDKIQSLPAFAVGVGLVFSGAFGRRLRRNKLLNSLRSSNSDQV